MRQNPHVPDLWGARVSNDPGLPDQPEPSRADRNRALRVPRPPHQPTAPSLTLARLTLGRMVRAVLHKAGPFAMPDTASPHRAGRSHGVALPPPRAFAVMSTSQSWTTTVVTS